jgi:hypothetical protein
MYKGNGHVVISFAINLFEYIKKLLRIMMAHISIHKKNISLF